MEYKCPEHLGTGMTPTDEICHAHESDLQQRFHNLHCAILRCPRALPGLTKYPDVPLIPPRSLIEGILRKLDRF